MLAVQAAGLRVSDQGGTSFLDDESIAPWARPYVAAAQRAGAVNGYPAQDGTAAWQGDRPVTRAEAALLLARLDGSAQVSVLTGESQVGGVPAWALTGAGLLSALPGAEASAPPDPGGGGAAHLVRFGAGIACKLRENRVFCY